MIVTVHPVNGSITVCAMIGMQFVKRVYYFFEPKDAINAFRKEFDVADI